MVTHSNVSPHPCCWSYCAPHDVQTALQESDSAQPAPPRWAPSARPSPCGPSGAGTCRDGRLQKFKQGILILKRAVTCLTPIWLPRGCEGAMHWCVLFLDLGLAAVTKCRAPMQVLRLGGGRGQRLRKPRHVPRGFVCKGGRGSSGQGDEEVWASRGTKSGSLALG